MTVDDMRKRHHYVPPTPSKPGGWVTDRPAVSDVELEVDTLALEERLLTGPGWVVALWAWVRR